ncbi:MAG: T9SS type A sorting domain-containing protein [Bacteroidetes bacterium]|nr:T9SS type A sorting domain-containing protein [Bacteroidota bacterium]
MYKSVDGGVTWNSLASTVSGTPQTFDNVWDATWNVVTDPGNLSQDVVYAAAYDAIFRSTNGGTSWSVVRGNSGTLATNSYFTDIAVSPTSVAYATLSSEGPQAGVWRSPTGVTWTNILPAGFPSEYGRLVIGIDPNNENTIYFFGPTPGFGKMSTDFQGDTLWNSLWKYQYISGTGAGAGGLWTDLSQNLPGNINVFNGMNTQGGYDVVVKVKPGNSNVVFLGGTNIFRSTSGFTDSTSTTVIGGYGIGATLPFVAEYPNHHPDQHVIAFLPSNPNVMFSANDGGISKTTDNTASSVSWNEIDGGFISSQFYTIAIDHSSTNDIIIGGLQDNGTYFTNNTVSTSPWEHSFDGDGSYCAIADAGATYYFSKQQGRMLKATLNASGVITSYRRFDPIGATGYGFINPYVIDPNNNNLMYLCAGKHIWRNDDLSGIALTNVYDSISTNWVQFADSLPLAIETLTAVAISKTPANTLYYGTNRRKIFKVANANIGNPTRTEITSTTFPSTGYTSCIAVNPDNADEIVVVFSNYSIYSIFQTKDGGVTWNRVAGNLEQNTNGTGNGPSCRWVEILPVADGTVYLAGTSTGLYATDTLINNGTIWVQQGTTNIGNAVVDMIDARTSDGQVVVATHGSGVFSTKITSVNQITSLSDVVASAISFNIYPNPVSDVLQLTWEDQLSNRRVAMTIVNELGQLVKQKEISTPAINKTTISVGDLPKGIYYIKLDSGKSNAVKSFVKL